MEIFHQFYQSKLSGCPEYGGSTYPIDRLLKIRTVKNWLQSVRHREVSLLDVGCGRGAFLLQFSSALMQLGAVTVKSISGCDLVQAEDNIFSQLKPEIQFAKVDLNLEKLPYKDASFDFVSCNHVLEHIFPTEQLLREMARVLKPDGLCIVSVPNLAAWCNRIALLFAGQPLLTEVGVESVSYGFFPGFFQKHLGQFHPAGHIRDFTPRALRDISKACGFEVRGWWNQDERWYLRLSSWAGRTIGIVLAPANGIR